MGNKKDYFFVSLVLILVSYIIVFLLTGCASTKVVNEMQKDISALRFNTSVNKAKLSDLENRIDRLEKDAKGYNKKLKYRE